MFAAYAIVNIWQYNQWCGRASTAGPRCYEVRDPNDLAMVAIALAALLASVVVPLVIAHLPLGTTAALALEVANILLALMLVVLALALAYRFGPNRPAHLNPPLFTWGLLVALLLWAIVSRGFVLFLANFNSYNQIYGSIGAVIALIDEVLAARSSR